MLVANYVVTGANRGIGLELCRQLKARGDDVIAICRKSSSALSELGVRIEDGVDVSDAASVAGLAERIDTDVDVLINNAGILTRETLDDLDFERIVRQFEVNSLGPLRVSAALLSRIGEGGKIAIITSRMGSIDDNTSGGSYGYRMSKAAVNAAGKSLSNDLKDRSIAVCLLHPGFVSTDMTGGRGSVAPPDAASGLLARIDALSLETTGTFWHMNGSELPW